VVHILSQLATVQTSNFVIHSTGGHNFPHYAHVVDEFLIPFGEMTRVVTAPIVSGSNKELSEKSQITFNRHLVKLNVGGVRYITTEATLTSKGENFFTAFLSNLVSGSWQCVKDEEDYLFIDRNGTAFEAVLEYLRTGKLFVPKGVSKEQVAEEFDYFSIADPEELETEAYKLATHTKWRTMAQMFFQANWADIKSKMYEMVVEHGLNCCTLTLVHENLSKEKKKTDKAVLERYYNNIRVSLDMEKFPPPLKPMFLDNLLYILLDYGFQASYINRQQTVDITVDWSLHKKESSPTTLE